MQPTAAEAAVMSSKLSATEAHLQGGPKKWHAHSWYLSFLPY